MQSHGLNFIVDICYFFGKTWIGVCPMSHGCGKVVRGGLLGNDGPCPEGGSPRLGPLMPMLEQQNWYLANQKTQKLLLVQFVCHSLIAY